MMDMGLDPRQRAYAAHALAALPRKVRLVLFTKAGFCPSCEAAEAAAEELASLTTALHVDVIPENAEDANFRLQAFGIDRLPALALTTGGEEPDNGIRFYGLPADCLWEAFVDTIRRVAEGGAELGPHTAAYLAQLRSPLRLQVFVTPACAYCPPMVALAAAMALASQRVRSEIIDALAFPDLARRYGVQGVPLTVINDQIYLEGSVPEDVLLAELTARQPLLAPAAR